MPSDLNGKMGWIVAMVALLFTAFSFITDFGRADQKIVSMERQLAAVMAQQSVAAETVAKHGTQFLDIERRLNATDRQLQSVSVMDSRLARIEVTVDLIGRQLGAPVPFRSPNP